jgi:hypothetical protein
VIVTAKLETDGQADDEHQCPPAHYSDSKPHSIHHTDGNRILICGNNIDRPPAALVSNKLLHEYIHAYDKCRGLLDGSCDGSACSEIRAYKRDRTCDGEPNYTECIKESATESAKDHCESYEAAREAVDRLFDRCFNKGLTD